MRHSCIFFALALATVPLASVAQSVTVVVNGATVNFSQPPIERAGRVFVPMRGVFERLGASVVYANGEVNATAHGRTISLTIGSTQATVAGHPQLVDVAPFVVADTTYVPLRFISQALGASVNWDDSTSTVTINAREPMPPAEQPPPQQPPPPPAYPGAIRFVSVSPTGTIYDPMPVVRFQFDRQVGLSDVRVTVDGQRATAYLRREGPNFVVDLPWRLAYGPHHVRVVGATASGAPFDLSWSFVRQ
jgi:hypothetical protein